jgi:Ca-activated chloride channel family protein
MTNSVFFLLPVMAAAVGVGQDAVFKTETRLLEVYATVQDQRGHYVDGLTKDRFSILDEGQPQPIVAFESETSALSVALLLDTTGSMQKALPSVKNAVVTFLDALRPSDAAAAYGFSASLNLLQDFTLDREALKRSVLRTRAGGNTALFDSIAQVAHDISARPGKKVIVVFTDGGDNASVLQATGAILRARKSGIPVYAIAEGDALRSSDLMKLLRSIAEGSGAEVYEARRLSDIDGILQEILTNVQHTYLLAYKPPPSRDANWRAIRLSVEGLKKYRLHAKEGYFPE